MEGGAIAMNSRLRLAGVMIAAGLAFQVLTLLVHHPLAFVAFIGVGCPLVAGGVAMFLWGLISSSREDASSAN